MNRILWIWLPDWPLQRLAVARPELSRRRVVLYELHPRGGLRVVAGESAGGIRPGMPLAEATALAEMPSPKAKSRPRPPSPPPNSLAPSPQPNPQPLLLEPHDPLANRAALVELAIWCERFSPAVALESAERPDGLALDVTGLGPLFGGEAALAERVVREFHDRGLSIRVAVADTLGAAWAAAHFPAAPACSGIRKNSESAGDLNSCEFSYSQKALPHSAKASRPTGESCCLIAPGAALLALAPLPVAALRLPPETVAQLRTVGIRTIGQLAALPRAALAARFGPPLLQHLDSALGPTSELLVPHRAAPCLAAEWAFETPCESAEAIQHVLDELIGRLSVALAARDEGALGFVCRIACADRRRIDVPIGLFRPSAARKHLAELLALRLETIRLESPVTMLSVEVTSAARLPHQQQELFAPDRRRDASQHLAALVDRLSSRLGREGVVRPCLLADAQPEYACVDLPWTGQGKQGAGSRERRATSRMRKLPEQKIASRSRRLPEPPAIRPIWLADAPRPIAVISLLPAGPPAQFQFEGIDYRVARSWGPERIETGWWRQAGIRRDYYRVETSTGQRFWLFRRLADARWFLQGAFG